MSAQPDASLHRRQMNPAQLQISPDQRESCPDWRDLSWIVGRVRGRCDASAIYLFGSHAKRGPHPHSDIDLLIVAPSRLPRMRRGRDVAAALAVFPRRFDLLFYTEQELAEECADPYSFISSVMSSARPLYVRGEPTPPELLATPVVEPPRLASVESPLEPGPYPTRPEAAEPVVELTVAEPPLGTAWWEDAEPVVKPAVVERSEPAAPAKPSGWASRAGGPLRIARALRGLVRS